MAWALTLTLAFRPLGAFIFGRLADRYGRRPVLMVNVAFYSLFGFLTAFAPSLLGFYVIRSLFGVAMGGVWGIGASLAFETVKSEKRGFVSGLLQSGYATGYLGASLVFGLLYHLIGWRGLFMVGLVPAAFLISYIWLAVGESPAHEIRKGTHVRLPLLGMQVAGILIGGFLTYLVATRLLYPNLGWYGVALILPAAAVIAYAASALCAQALAALAVRGGDDDRFQFLQPWHAGHLSHLPAEAARLRHRHGVHHRGALQHRGHHRRHRFRQPEPAHWAGAAPPSPAPCWACQWPFSGPFPVRRRFWHWARS